MNAIHLCFWWFVLGQLAFLLWNGQRFCWGSKKNTLWRNDGGEHYEYREERSKADVLVNMVMSFAAPAGIYFSLRPRTWFDRFSRLLRLVHEPQLGDAEFDACYFLDAEDANIIQWWRQNGALRSHFDHLIKRLAMRQTKMYALTCDNGKLHLSLFVRRTPNAERLRTECVGWLSPLLTALRGEPQLAVELSSGPSVSQRNARHILLPRRICFGLFVFGTFSIVWYGLMSSQPLLDPLALLKRSTSCALLLFPFLLWWALRTSGPATGRHWRFLEWLCLGLIGLVLSSFFLLGSINIHLDLAMPLAVPVTELSVSQRYERKWGTIYTVAFRSDHPELKPIHGYSISEWRYRTLKNHWGGSQKSSGMVYLHPGALGHAWVEVAY